MNELGTVHGPWDLTWRDHDAWHRAREHYEPTYVLSPLGDGTAAWCGQCQRGVLMEGAGDERNNDQ